MAVPGWVSAAAALFSAGFQKAFGGTIAVVSATSVGSIATVLYSYKGTSLPGGSGTISQSFGVPGPELATGLPILALGAAFAGYKYFKNKRAAVKA